MEMLGQVVADEYVEPLGMDVAEHEAQRPFEMVRVTHKEGLWAVECAEIQRYGRARGIRRDQQHFRYLVRRYPVEQLADVVGPGRRAKADRIGAFEDVLVEWPSDDLLARVAGGPGRACQCTSTRRSA